MCNCQQFVGAALGVAVSVLSAASVFAQAEVTEPAARSIATEKSIAMFEKRVEKNPKDYLSYTTLGLLYMRQAKETDDFAGFARAEEAFRKSLATKPDHVAAKASLASAFASQHKFADAAELCEEILTADPNYASALATLGDAQLEMGDYQQAADSYDRLAKLGTAPAVQVRLARLHELKGETDQATLLFGEAANLQRAAAGLLDTEAWYFWRYGLHLFTAGKLAQAEEQFREALKSSPNYPQALVGLAATQAAQGHYGQSIETYQRAIELSEEPPFLAGLGDVYSKMGDAGQAKQFHDRAEAGMAEEAKDPDSASAHRREVAVFYLDHDRRLPEALELARKDYADRRDIHSADTLAWALYKNDQPDEAQKYAAEALRLGTRDARLHFHAGMIALRLDRRDKALEHLKRALEINPAFSLRDAEVAKQTVQTLAE